MNTATITTAIAATMLVFTAALSIPAQAAGPAARLNDLTTHTGRVQQASGNVLINGLPAARLGHFASCPLVAPVPHVGGNIATGSASVRINGFPAARVGDTISEVGAVSQISNGSPNVIIGN